MHPLPGAALTSSNNHTLPPAPVLRLRHAHRPVGLKLLPSLLYQPQHLGQLNVLLRLLRLLPPRLLLLTAGLEAHGCGTARTHLAKQGGCRANRSPRFGQGRSIGRQAAQQTGTHDVALRCRSRQRVPSLPACEGGVLAALPAGLPRSNLGSTWPWLHPCAV